MSYVVEVTYGTRRHMVFAESPDLEGAQKLKELAIERKYFDAKIIPKKDFLKAQAQGGRS